MADNGQTKTMRVAVIGDGGSVYGYKLIGMEVFAADTAEKAQQHLRLLAEQDYAIIYLSEGYFASLEDLVSELSLRETPAIIPIPTAAGSSGYSARRISSFVEKAVGSDILFGQQT